MLSKAKRKVFSKPNRADQDKKLSFLMTVNLPKRRRSSKAVVKRPRTINRFSVQLFLLSSENKKLRVCSKFFQKLFGIGQRRMNTIAEGIISGEGVKDKRGGDHKLKKYGDKRSSVYNFISKLNAKESHYSRNKSRRLYLPSTLNINQLFLLYNDSVEAPLKVKKTFFVKIFATKFNLGFGSPASDTCSYCHRLKNKIEMCRDSKEKQTLIAEIGAHRLRAKTFHKIMKENISDCVSYVFDLQQVQPLPKLNIGEAYYSRQISYYCFCVTDTANKNSVLYTWDESQAGRGAVEVGSALIDFLNKACIASGVKTIRLFSDGCAGQNKNQHIVHTLAFWLHKSSNIKQIIMYFPVRGHSYLPADRIFGQLEKKLRRREEIVNLDEYNQLYREVAEVRVLGKDWEIKNVKALVDVFKKIDGISSVKRIFLKKIEGVGVKIKTEPTYRCDDPTKFYASMVKRGKNF